MLYLIPFFLLGISNVLNTNIYSKLEFNEHKKYNLDEAEEIFLEFIKKHAKNYESEKEYEHRLRVFIDNLKKLNEWNENPTVDFKINQFTDMTYDEFSEKHTGCVFDGATNPEDVMEYVPTGKAPESLDWRQQNLVTEVKDQGQCGSCFVFSAVGCVEGQHAKKHKQLISLSEQQGLDCDPNGDCDFGGLPHQNMNALAKQGGAMKEEDYPYEQFKGQCRTDSSKIAVKVTGGKILAISDEEILKSAVAEYGPLAIGVNAGHQFMGYGGGVLHPTDCNETGNHAVLAVGYGTENGTPYWLIKNSWGAVWGEQGYIRLRRGLGICALATYTALAAVD